MKKSIYYSFILFLLISTIHCSGTNLVDQFQADVSAHSGAVNVLALQHDRKGEEIEADTDGSKTFVTDLGYEVVLTEAHLHFHEIFLLSEGEDPDCLGGMDQEIPIHHDHDLLGEDLVTHPMATALIPMAYYCEFELMLGSEGPAAVKLDHADTGADVPDTPEDAFHLVGTWSKDEASGAFELVGATPAMVHHVFKTLENGEVIEHPAHFHEGETVIEVLIGTKYDALFDGVDFNAMDSAGQLGKVYENLGTAVHQHTGDYRGGTGDHQH